jgi:hypothetical protein
MAVLDISFEEPGNGLISHPLALSIEAQEPQSFAQSPQEMVRYIAKYPGSKEQRRGTVGTV